MNEISSGIDIVQRDDVCPSCGETQSNARITTGGLIICPKCGYCYQLKIVLQPSTSTRVFKNNNVVHKTGTICLEKC